MFSSLLLYLLFCCVGENWQEAMREDLSSMHILTPLTLALDIYKCIITDTSLPKYVTD